MQRTLKFRAKRLDNGKWAYGSLDVKPNGECRIIWYEKQPGEKPKRHVRNVDPRTVGQYVGKARYDADAYEGDILDGGDDTYVLEWHGTAFLLLLDDNVLIEAESLDCLGIIGNVHDNNKE